MRRLLAPAAALALALVACDGGKTDPAPQPEQPAKPALASDKGVDVEKKVIRVGTLNDESGPGAAIGKQFAIGKRVLAASVNAGGSGLLPEGWTIELVERDHGYNPQAAVQAYNEIQEQILFVGTSFSTPATLPLRPMLERDRVVAFPASLSSAMAENEMTPPLGPTYQYESARAVDWVVESAGGADKAKLAIVYQDDDYGKDGLAGMKAAAEKHGITIVAEQTVTPGQKDMAAVVTGLKDAGATHVVLTVLPSATGPILGTAAQLKYMPTWIGLTPAWIDAFYNPEVIPSAVFTNYHQLSGLPFWGEDVPGMDAFLKAWDTHGKEMGNPDSYILLSYIQGLVQVEAAKRAIEGMDITRAGYIKALHGVKEWNAGGMVQPLSLGAVPYTVGTQVRVLKPDFENKTWTVVSDYAEPSTVGGVAAGPAGEAPPAQAPGGAAAPKPTPKGGGAGTATTTDGPPKKAPEGGASKGGEKKATGPAQPAEGANKGGAKKGGEKKK
ncbi:MAG: ABC transporter substrate-binding protein [Alphaproteobacteria bacterium]|nr:ABC transporter substrate-binding protein [Alphaproteobacteria bacterium]MCB9796665.1 ABC transporter substrate-binding protein [Alphaproteobacteria bacterium]